MLILLSWFIVFPSVCSVDSFKGITDVFGEYRMGKEPGPHSLTLAAPLRPLRGLLYAGGFEGNSGSLCLRRDP